MIRPNFGVGETMALTEHDYLQMALVAANQGRGFCAPNPAVGAVIVKDNRVLASGYHRAAGRPHAEVEALSQLEQANGAIVYVTLEPCCHWGKTPPCTDLLINKGITRLVYAYSDPNPHVAGKGISQLVAAGIECEKLTLDSITEFYQSYHYWLKTHKPWVTAKIALSLDGKIAAEDSSPLAITGTELQQLTHQQRLHSDAILTTVKTLLNDDPQMNARLDGKTFAKPVFVLDRELNLTTDLQIFTTAQSITLFHQADVDTHKLAALQQKNIHCVAIPVANHLLDLQAVLKNIGEAGIHNLWVEAGGQLTQALLTQQFANRALIYVAAKTLGQSALAAFDLAGVFATAKQKQWHPLGEDVFCDVRW